jgi:hypothetical protein
MSQCFLYPYVRKLFMNPLLKVIFEVMTATVDRAPSSQQMTDARRRMTLSVLHDRFDPIDPVLIVDPLELVQQVKPCHRSNVHLLYHATWVKGTERQTDEETSTV